MGVFTLGFTINNAVVERLARERTQSLNCSTAHFGDSHPAKMDWKSRGNEMGNENTVITRDIYLSILNITIFSDALSHSSRK
jgi:hypothetical protein